ncbi:MAG: glycosyltransferase [Muribaculaceae bacterium]|nr:glycosyltransferase [Muribaculaceae bacterium]
MSHPSPLLSIITVTYNASQVLGPTLQSLKSQTFRDFEHIVVDGNSSDSTLRLIEDAGIPSRVISEPDRGLYDAMNKGIDLARGKYILFLNAGDSFHDPDTLSLYAQAAAGDPDIIYGDTIIVDSEGKKIADRHLKAPEKLTSKSFANGMLICHQAFMVKKNLVPLYDLSYRFSADYDWCVKCIAKSRPDKCHNLQSVTIKYLNDGLTDKNKIPSLLERFRIMSRHYGLIPTTLRHFRFLLRSLRR